MGMHKTRNSRYGAGLDTHYEETAITKQALTWNPQGKRGRRRPQNTWRRSTEQEFKKKGLTWKQLERMAQDNGLCSERNTKA